MRMSSFNRAGFARRGAEALVCIDLSNRSLVGKSRINLKSRMNKFSLLLGWFCIGNEEDGAKQMLSLIEADETIFVRTF